MSNKIDLSGGFNRLQPSGIAAFKDSMFAHAKTYANRTTREADATLTANDINIIALQIDEKSMWLLTANGPPPVWVELPVAYVAPTFSAFAISGQTTPLEVGASIAASRTFTWTTTSPSNVEANSVSLLDVTGGNVVIASGLVDDSSEATAYPAAPITKTAATSHTFRVGATSTRGAAFTRDYSVAWQWRRYYGTSAAAGPLNEAAVKALSTTELSSSFSGSLTFGAGDYKYIAYASSLGDASSFKDAATSLDIAMEAPYIVTLTTLGVAEIYNVHRTTNVIGSAITIVVA
jgi:hypothetical protein